jgi:predicted RNA methylase
MKKLLSLYPTFLPAIESYENIKSNVIDRWHFRMLNDGIRNLYYFHAIQTVIHKYKTVTNIDKCIVLDIGGGTGLLSIYAVLAGATHVYCCEVSASLAYICKLCINDNNKYNILKDKISVINKYSTDVKIGIDLPGRVNVIITELVDSGLLGEHIIPVLQHAQQELLVQDCTGIIIPHSAVLYGFPLFSCPEIVQRQVMVNPALLTCRRSTYNSSNQDCNGNSGVCSEDRFLS